MSHQPVRLPSELAALLRSDRVFLAARDVAEIEYRKHADAGVSVGGSVTAATRAALDVAIGAIFDAGGSGVAARIDALTTEQIVSLCQLGADVLGVGSLDGARTFRKALARLLREEPK